MNLYRLEVAPLIILPLSRSPFFSYLHGEPVPLGSLVSISFGKQLVQGVVYDCQAFPQKPPRWLKYVGRILRPELLTKNQRELALQVSHATFTPLGRTLRHFVPTIVQERKKPESKAPQTPSKVRLTSPEKVLLKKAQALEDASAFFSPLTLPDPKRFYMALAQAWSQKEGQTLILVPEITLLPALESLAGIFFPKKRVAVLQSQLAKGRFWSAWERIQSGEAHLILSTRQGLFAPFKNLGLIIVSEEQDESYKQWDMSPRYDGKRVAEYLRARHKATLLLASPTPSAEVYYQVTQGLLPALTPLSEAPPLAGALTIVNLRLERFKKNYSPLSQDLLYRLREILGAKKQALLYVQRQGLSVFSICAQCKTVFRCPESGHTLVSYRDGYYRCLACNYKTGLFPNCPACGHVGFKNVGLGTEKLEREIERALPGARVFRADQTTMKSEKNQHKLFQDGRAGKIDILIGTQMILKDPPLPNLSLVAMIDADSLLSFPDFRADERLFQNISRGVKQVGNPGKSTGQPHVLIQTFHPESTFFQRVTGLSEREVYTAILRDREDLGYPPFSRLASLICQDPILKKAEARAQKIYAEARAHFAPFRDIRMTPPTSSKTLARGKFFESKIFLRLPPTDPLPDHVSHFLLRLGKDVIIDMDPLSLQ